MDIKYPLMVVATAERKMVVVNLTNPDRIYATINSPLKYQSRSVACFPDQQGFCLGSIEGRVAVHHVHDRDSSKNFAFKCHRDNQVGMRFTHPPHTQTNALAHTSTPLPPRLSSPLHLAVVIMDPIAYFPPWEISPPLHVGSAARRTFTLSITSPSTRPLAPSPPQAQTAPSTFGTRTHGSA